MLKAVLLDIDNTLLSFDEYVKEAMKRGFKEFKLCEYNEEMFSVFTEINNQLWRSLEQGEIDLEELKRVRWNMIFDRLGILADGVLFEKYFRAQLFESAIPEKGAKELLKYLHGKYILCAASNGPYNQQVNRLKIGGMLPYFDHLFISEEIGHTKPSFEFFDICLKRLNEKSEIPLNPNNLMMIGDSLSSDMAGGIQFGMKTCLYTPVKKDVPKEMKIDYIIESLAEIERIL